MPVSIVATVIPWPVAELSYAIKALIEARPKLARNSAVLKALLLPPPPPPQPNKPKTKSTEIILYKLLLRILFSPRLNILRPLHCQKLNGVWNFQSINRIKIKRLETLRDLNLIEIAPALRKRGESMRNALTERSHRFFT